EHCQRWACQLLQRGRGIVGGNLPPSRSIPRKLLLRWEGNNRRPFGRARMLDRGFQFVPTLTAKGHVRKELLMRDGGADLVLGKIAGPQLILDAIYVLLDDAHGWSGHQNDERDVLSPGCGERRNPPPLANAP